MNVEDNDTNLLCLYEIYSHIGYLLIRDEIIRFRVDKYEHN